MLDQNAAGGGVGVVVEQTGPYAVRVVGDLDMETVRAFVDGVRGAWTDVTRTVSVDVERVTFFDSSGLKGLLQLRRTGVDIRLVNVTEPVQRILDLTGLGCLFGVDRVQHAPH